MVHRFLLVVVALQLALVGCGRESGGRDRSGDSNGNEAKHDDTSAKPRQHHDNAVHILPVGADAEADEQRIEFGKAKQAKVFLHPFEVANPRSEPVVIDAVTSSCECFSIPNLPRRIPARKRTRVACSIDLSTEPDFHGDLAIDVHLQSGGKDVAVFKAAFSVAPDESALPAREKPKAK